MSANQHAAAQRNMRLVVALLESVPEQALTDAEWQTLHWLLFQARLLASAILARPDQDADYISNNITNIH